MSNVKKQKSKSDKNGDKQELTFKQKLFCDYFLETGNATQSAIRAGYSPKTAHSTAKQTLERPYIKEYIDKMTKDMESTAIAKAEEVMTFLTSTMRETITRMEEVKDEETGKIELKEVKVVIPMKTRIRAAELLGKRYQLFTDRIEVQGTFTPIIIQGEAEFKPEEDMIVED